MRLWLLSPNHANGYADHGRGRGGDDPWSPWYDRMFGAVVRAETEDEARRLCDAEGAEENSSGKAPWTNPGMSVCVELSAEGEPGVIITDVHAA